MKLRPTSLPLAELLLTMLVGFASLGICLSVDSYRSVMQMYQDEREGVTFTDTNPLLLHEAASGKARAQRAPAHASIPPISLQND